MRDLLLDLILDFCRWRARRALARAKVWIRREHALIELEMQPVARDLPPVDVSNPPFAVLDEAPPTTQP